MQLLHFHLIQIFSSKTKYFRSQDRHIEMTGTYSYIGNSNYHEVFFFMVCFRQKNLIRIHSLAQRQEKNEGHEFFIKELENNIEKLSQISQQLILVWALLSLHNILIQFRPHDLAFKKGTIWQVDKSLIYFLAKYVGFFQTFCLGIAHLIFKVNCTLQ